MVRSQLLRSPPSQKAKAPKNRNGLVGKKPPSADGSTTANWHGKDDADITCKASAGEAKVSIYIVDEDKEKFTVSMDAFGKGEIESKIRKYMAKSAGLNMSGKIEFERRVVEFYDD